MDEWLGYILIGVAVTASALAALAALRRTGPTAPEPEADGDAGDSFADLVFGDLTAALAGTAPAAGRDRVQVLPELLKAGYYKPSALDEYRAVRTALVLAPLAAAVAAAALVPPRLIPWVLGGGLLLALLGYSVPRLYVALKVRSRQREIETGLPVFADLLSIALMAGQSLLLAMGRVTEQLRKPFPGLATELEIVLRQADLMNLATAFELWAERSQVMEVRNLSVIVTQAQRLGNDPAPVLMDYASNLRVGLRQRADAQAQRTTFWLLFPTIGLLWVPTVVLLLSPAFFEFGTKREDGVGTLRTGFQELKKSRTGNTAPTPDAK